MRIKNFYLIVFLFVISFFNTDYVMASADDFDYWTHELTYDVEKVNITDTTITFNGWAFIDHLDNYGGKNLQISITAKSGDKSYTVVEDTYSSRNLTFHRCGGERCSDTGWYDKKISNAENNRYDYLCIYGVSSEYDQYLNGCANCNAGSHASNSSCLYYKVGFSISFNINDLVNYFGEISDISFYINGRLTKFGISSTKEGSCPRNGPWPCSRSNNGDIVGASDAVIYSNDKNTTIHNYWWKTLPLGVTQYSLYVNGSSYPSTIYEGANYSFEFGGMSDELDVTFNGPSNLTGSGVFASKNNFFMEAVFGSNRFNNNFSGFVNNYVGEGRTTFVINKYNHRETNNYYSGKNNGEGIYDKVATYDVYGVLNSNAKYYNSGVIFPTNTKKNVYRVAATAVTVGGFSGLLTIKITPKGKMVSCEEKYGIGDVNVDGIEDLAGIVDRRDSISVGSVDRYVSSAEYNQCTTKKISSGVNVHYRNGTCSASISVNTNILLHETGKMTVGDLFSVNDNKEYNVVYAGGGFSIGNTSYVSSLTWDYGIVSKDDITKPSFTYKLSDYIGNCGENFDISDILDNSNDRNFYLSSTSNNAYNLYDASVINLSSYVTSRYNNYVNDLSGIVTSFDSNSGTNDETSLVKIGKWSSSNSESLNVGESKTIINIFDLEDAYIKFNDISAVYGEKYSSNSEYMFAGKYYYTSLYYESDYYYVYVNNLLNSNRKMDSSLSKIFDWYFGSRLSIDIVQKDSNLYDNEGYDLEFYYRSIDVDNPFPRSVSQNWVEWYKDDKNKLRISKSESNLNNPLYSVNITKNNLDTIVDSDSYVDWNGINKNGVSDFIEAGRLENNNSYVIDGKFRNTTSYCPLGAFNENCDLYDFG